MRSEQEMLDLILKVAGEDEGIRAVVMNGSRVNPDAQPDMMQDYDIVYYVTNVERFKADREWTKQFGEILIMQTPDDMFDQAPNSDGGYMYMMQFADGTRIDLGLWPVAAKGGRRQPEPGAAG